MRLLTYVALRALAALATLLGVSVLVFLAIHLVPGGYEVVLLGPFATEERRAVVRATFGLDAPLSVQYLRWLASSATGDFGISFVTQKSVGAEILRRAPVTIQLTSMATLIALVVGLPLGVLSGLTGSRHLTRGLGRLVGALGASVPDFVLGTLFVYVFSVWSLGLSVGGYVPFLESPMTNLRAMVLPSVTLGVFGIALILRTTRESVLGVLTEPHITAAVAQGEGTWDIVRHHVLRNAAIPVVTVTATYMGYLLGGTVIVETLFSVPGVGLFIVNAIRNRDYAVVEAGVLLAAVFFVMLNMLADVIYAVLDPRMGARR
jgi:peptide/nickel transport system permease protein